MKAFKPIKTKRELDAICQALNLLFWKLPFPPYPKWWCAKMRDAGIDLKWDREEMRFKPRVAL